MTQMLSVSGEYPKGARKGDGTFGQISVIVCKTGDVLYVKKGLTYFDSLPGVEVDIKGRFEANGTLPKGSEAKLTFNQPVVLVVEDLSSSMKSAQYVRFVRTYAEESLSHMAFGQVGKEAIDCNWPRARWILSRSEDARSAQNVRGGTKYALWDLETEVVVNHSTPEGAFVWVVTIDELNDLIVRHPLNDKDIERLAVRWDQLVAEVKELGAKIDKMAARWQTLLDVDTAEAVEESSQLEASAAKIQALIDVKNRYLDNIKKAMDRQNATNAS